MGKKRSHSSEEKSDPPSKKTSSDCTLNYQAQNSLRNRESEDSCDSDISPSHHHRKAKRDKKKRKHKESRRTDKHKRKHKKKKRKSHSSKKNEDTVGPSLPMTKPVADFPDKEGKSVAETSAVTSSRQIRAPMTKAEWEKQQSVIRRVHDPTTGRERLVKGDGEILEEIVSKERHKHISKQSTMGDGLYYESQAQFHS